MHAARRVPGLPGHAEATERSLALTLAAGLAARRPRRHGRAGARALFGIVQGGAHRGSAPARRGRDRARWASTATRSAGWRSGSRRTMMYDLTAALCAARLPARPAALPHGRRQAGGPRGVRRARAWTCSTACCRRATRATARPSRATGRSPSSRRASRAIPRRSTTVPLRGLPALLARLPAPPVHGARAPGLPPAVAAQLTFYLGLMADMRDGHPRRPLRGIPRGGFSRRYGAEAWRAEAGDAEDF